MDQILLTKLISALVYPIGLVIILGLVGWLFSAFGWRKLAGTLKFGSVLILLLSSNPMVARSLVASLEQQYPQQAFEEIEKHQAILVLGGGLRIPLPPAQQVQIGSGSDRYWHAVQLFRAGLAEKIIVSGGNVFNQVGFQGEAYYAADLLQQWGVPGSAIVIETSSRNTSQNFNNTANYLRQREIDSVLLVTSAVHMPRAYQLFSNLPGKVTPAAADVLIRRYYKPAIFDWLPSANALSLTSVAAHEYYGMWAAELKALMANFR